MRLNNGLLCIGYWVLGIEYGDKTDRDPKEGVSRVIQKYCDLKEVVILIYLPKY